MIELILAITTAASIQSSPIPDQPFFGDTYTILSDRIVDQNNNVTEWFPESFEDQSWWDCKTMGNRMCGFQAPISGQWYTVQY